MPTETTIAACNPDGAEIFYHIKDAALGWLEVKDVKLRYRVEREGERDADLMMFNTPDEARRFLETR